MPATPMPQNARAVSTPAGSLCCGSLAPVPEPARPTVETRSARVAGARWLCQDRRRLKDIGRRIPDQGPAIHPRFFDWRTFPLSHLDLRSAGTMGSTRRGGIIFLCVSFCPSHSTNRARHNVDDPNLSRGYAGTARKISPSLSWCCLHSF